MSEYEQWQPEKTHEVYIDGLRWSIGIDSYRFYVKNGNQEWVSCMEFKHDDVPNVERLAQFFFDKAIL